VTLRSTGTAAEVAVCAGMPNEAMQRTRGKIGPDGKSKVASR
jgi:hypothetical protein